MPINSLRGLAHRAPFVLAATLLLPATAAPPLGAAVARPPALALASSVTPTRLAGADRYGTAAAVAQAAFPSGTTTALVARGDEFPDALTAAPLAAKLHAALLLTQPDALPAVTAQALQTLGVRTVIVLGGATAVSPGVVAQLDRSYQVSRVFGADRYATAAAVAAKLASLGPVRSSEGHVVAFFVTGDNFPDAVVAGPPAAVGTPAPILLLHGGTVPATTAAEIRALHVTQGWTLGGDAVVPNPAVAALQADGVHVDRVGGANREATAVAVARTFVSLLPAARVVLARGDAFSDALVAGPYAARVGAPVLLTLAPASLGSDSVDGILATATARGAALGLTAVGGPTAISDGALAQAAAAAGGGAPAGDCTAAKFVALSPAQRIGQLFMVGVDASAGPTSATTTAVADDHVGGVILTGRSSAGVTATRAIVNRVQALVNSSSTGGVPLWVSADQEGGEVQVLSGPGFSTIPTGVAQGQLSTSTLRTDWGVWGRQLAAAGVTENLAPVVDVVPPGNPTANQPIGRYYRELGYEPEPVAAHGESIVHGLATANVSATLKHFPGLGRASGNTDVTVGVKDTVTTPDDPYLLPFQGGVGAGARFVMVSLAIYTRIDGAHVAAFSPTIILGILRSSFGFGGVVMSDSLDAAAVGPTPVTDRAADFIAAGGDIALVTEPTTLQAMVDGVSARSGSDVTFRTRVEDAALKVLREKAAAGLLPGCH